jgi:hypothetical protein
MNSILTGEALAKRGEHTMKRRAVVERYPRRQLRLEPPNCRRASGVTLAAAFREQGMNGPAIVRRRDAPDEPVAFEPVRQLGDVTADAVQ